MFENITIIISIGISLLALIVAGCSARYSGKSAKVAEASLQHIRTPLLIIEKKGSPYFFIKNIGNGLAKNVRWNFSNGLETRTDSENFDFLLPNAQTLSDSEMNPDGIEIKLVIPEVNLLVDKEYILDITYEDIDEKQYSAKFKIAKNKSGDVKHKIIKI